MYTREEEYFIIIVNMHKYYMLYTKTYITKRYGCMYKLNARKYAHHSLGSFTARAASFQLVPGKPLSSFCLYLCLLFIRQM